MSSDMTIRPASSDSVRPASSDSEALKAQKKRALAELNSRPRKMMMPKRAFGALDGFGDSPVKPTKAAA